ncbi:MAG: OmpA family protein [Leptospirales bacterium]|nr:OmpA family protein [Leptospirales bacterium]
MNNKKNIPGFLLSIFTAILFLHPAVTFALTDLEKCQNEKTALELELQRQGDKIQAKIDELEAETQKKQAEIDAQLADKEKELDSAKAEVEAAKKETEDAKKETEDAKKEIEAAKKETEAAKKETETAKKAVADSEARLKACNDREKALQSRIQELETQLREGGQGRPRKSGGLQNKTPHGSPFTQYTSEDDPDGEETDDPDGPYDEQFDKEKIAALEAALEDLNTQLEECKDRVRTQKERIDKFESQKKDFQKELHGEIRDGDVRMPDNGRKRIVINIDDRISFDPGSATLKRNVYPTLNKIAKVIENYPEHKVLVAGHTDSDPISRANFKDNMELSEARANAVLDYLLRNTNLDESRFRARGFGERRPVAKNNTPGNKALNRRVDIIVVPADRDIPEDTEEDDEE